MAQRNIWADVYGIGHSVGSISSAVVSATGLPLLNHPDMNPGVNVINNRKAVGTSYRQSNTGLEYQQGIEIPNTSWELDVSKSSLNRILWALFQKGSFQGGSTVYPKYFVPYDDPECEVWLSLFRKLAAAGTSESHRIYGAIVKSITLSSEENQALKATVSYEGYDFDDSRDAGSETLTFASDAVLLWQNAALTLEGNSINIPSFSITINNNGVTKTYDAQNPIKHVLNDFTVEGTFTLPRADANEGGNNAIDDFVNGTVSRLVIRWGSNEIATADGDFSIITNIRRTGAPVAGEDEIVTEVAFEGVSGTSSSSVKTSTASTVAIAGSTTVTGTNTEFSSFEKGDLLYVDGATAAGDRTVRIITNVASATSLSVFPAFSGTEGSLTYRVKQTPFSLSLGDSVNLSGM